MSAARSWDEWAKDASQAPAPTTSAVTQLLLTGKEAAKLVALCEKSLYLATRRGELRAVKIGRAVRYRVEDLRQWIDSKVQAQESARA